MTASNATENALLLLIFNNVDFANVGDAAGIQGSSTAGSLYVSLHFADPDEDGVQTSSEATYTGYARIEVARSSSDWTVTDNSVTNTNDIVFGACTGGDQTISHWGIGTTSSGDGILLFSGALESPLSVTSSPSQIPKFVAGKLTVNAD